MTITGLTYWAIFRSSKYRIGSTHEDVFLYPVRYPLDIFSYIWAASSKAWMVGHGSQTVRFHGEDVVLQVTKSIGKNHVGGNLVDPCLPIKRLPFRNMFFWPRFWSKFNFNIHGFEFFPVTVSTKALKHCITVLFFVKNPIGFFFLVVVFCFHPSRMAFLGRPSTIKELRFECFSSGSTQTSIHAGTTLIRCWYDLEKTSKKCLF